MGRVVIVAYRPKAGQRDKLRALTRDHVAILRQEGLATDREPIAMEAADGTVVEVFEWVSAEAIEAAHKNDAVNRMWAEYAEVCDYIPAAQVEELSQLFSEFTPID